MEILPGIHRVPGLRWSNSYLIVEEKQLTLVDAGLPGDGRKILNYISRIGRAPLETGEVDRHPQPPRPHRVSEKCCPSSPGPRSWPIKRTPGSGERTRPTGCITQDNRPHLTGMCLFLQRIPAHEFIEDGQLLPVLSGLRVVHTPGHTAGSVCLYLDEQKLLFTGDTLVADGYCFRRPVPFPGTNFRDYRVSVDRLGRLPFETACVGHGQPLLGSGAAALQEMLKNYFWFAPRWSWLKRRVRHPLSNVSRR